MAISYPLTFPTIDGKSLVRKMTMRLVHSVAVTESPFNYKQQTQDFGGARWEAEVTLRPLTLTEAKEVSAFFASLKGAKGTFLFGNPLHDYTSGAPVATVSGAHSAGVTTVTLAHTQTPHIAVGDHIQLDNHLHMVLKKGSGTNTFAYDITPPVRQALSNTDSVTTDAPKGTWRLAKSESEWDINVAQLYEFTFACVEAI